MYNNEVPKKSPEMGNEEVGETFLKAKAVFNSEYTFQNFPALVNSKNLESVLVNGQEYEFELVRVRSVSYGSLHQSLIEEGYLLAGAQGFILVQNFIAQLPPFASVISFSDNIYHWHSNEGLRVPRLSVHSNGSQSVSLIELEKQVSNDFLLRIHK